MATQTAIERGDQALPDVEQYDTIVIGGGQAGLSAGYYLKQQGRSFVILDANERIGGSWRTRTWDSLRLFTPARYDSLPGWPFPAPGWSYPSARETADYLEAYATRFDLPVRLRTRVDRLSKVGDRYLAESGARRFEAAQVVVASGFYGKPSVPDFAVELDPRDRADALQRVPQPVPAAAGRGPARRRRQLRARTSRWRSPRATRPGSRGRTKGRFRFGSSTRSGGSSCPCSGSSLPTS